MCGARDHGCPGCVTVQRHPSWTRTRHLPVVRQQTEKNSSPLQQRQEENTTLSPKIIIQEDFYFLSPFSDFQGSSGSSNGTEGRPKHSELAQPGCADVSCSFGATWRAAAAAAPAPCSSSHSCPCTAISTYTAHVVMVAELG